MPAKPKPEDVERGLQAVAAFQGSTTEATKHLTAIGHPIPRQTLDRWVKELHTERYLEIRKQEAPRLAAIVAAELENKIPKAMQVQAKMYDELDSKVSELKPGELSRSIKDVGLDIAVTVDKVNLLRDKPTSISEVRTMDYDTVVRLRMKLEQEIEEEEATETTGFEVDTDELPPAA